jgi:predicted permease
MTEPHLVPDYYPAFSCKMGACRHACCEGWPISVSMKDYFTLLGLRNEMLVPVLIFFGAPTAVSSFPMAQQMDGDGELAASLVVFTSALSILTIFVWVFVLKTLALI